MVSASVKVGCLTGLLFMFSVRARAHTKHQPAPTGISQSKAKRVQEYVVAGRCLLMLVV